MAEKTKQGRIAFTAIALLTALIIGGVACSTRENEQKVEAAGPGPSVKPPASPQPQPQSSESRSVDPAVQSHIEKAEAAKRVSLLSDAVAALDDTRNALTALDRGDKQAALAALQSAAGKLDVVVARDPKMAVAPVDVVTTMIDVYATPDAVRAAVKEARDDLQREDVQPARHLLQDLASEADIHVTEIPLATYPAAIRAVAPLIDAGRIDEAKAALSAALNTLVIETFAMPLPQLRAEAMLVTAEALAKNSRSKHSDEATKVHALVEAARQQLQLAETLGYGTKDSYKPLYAQLDDIRKQTEAGQSGTGLFDKLRQSIRKFRFSV